MTITQLCWLLPWSDLSLCVPETSESLETHVLGGGSRLQLARPQPLDGGVYTCVASNVEGEAHNRGHSVPVQGARGGARARVAGYSRSLQWVPV